MKRFLTLALTIFCVFFQIAVAQTNCGTHQTQQPNCYDISFGGVAAGYQNGGIWRTYIQFNHAGEATDAPVNFRATILDPSGNPIGQKIVSQQFKNPQSPTNLVGATVNGNDTTVVVLTGPEECFAIPIDQCRSLIEGSFKMQTSGSATSLDVASAVYWHTQTRVGEAEPFWESGHISLLKKSDAGQVWSVTSVETPKDQEINRGVLGSHNAIAIVNLANLPQRFFVTVIESGGITLANRIPTALVAPEGRTSFMLKDLIGWDKFPSGLSQDIPITIKFEAEIAGPFLPEVLLGSATSLSALTPTKVR